jgi:hypothetical protein
MLLVYSGLLEHDCLEIMDDVFSSWSDLIDKPIGHPDVEYFADGISFVQDCMCFARYMVVTLDSGIESHPLLVGTSAQKAELATLMWALQLTAGLQVKFTLAPSMPSKPFTSLGP